MTVADFLLPDEDEEFLTAHFPSRWCKREEEGEIGIIISDYPLPADLYTADKSDLMLIIPADYPTSGLDMFYFSPELSRKDGRTINAIAKEIHFEREWQRWSRHYEWEPGTDSIVSHISYVSNQLKHDSPA